MVHACARCGAPFLKNSKYCTGCGAVLSAGPAPGLWGRGQALGTWTASLLVLLAVGGAYAYWHVRMQSAETLSPSPSPSILAGSAAALPAASGASVAWAADSPQELGASRRAAAARDDNMIVEIDETPPAAPAARAVYRLAESAAGPSAVPHNSRAASAAASNQVPTAARRSVRVSDASSPAEVPAEALRAECRQQGNTFSRTLCEAVQCTKAKYAATPLCQRLHEGAEKARKADPPN